MGCRGPRERFTHGFHDELSDGWFKGALDFDSSKIRLWQSADAQNAYWVRDRINEIKDTKQPFFAAFGSFRPHLPWYVPQRFFDLYDLDDIELPTNFESYGNEHWVISAMVRHNKLKEALRAYYASVSFADACFRILLNHIDADEYLRDNTIVVLTSDHGYHLGEHGRWAKYKPWERCTRVPLLIRVPGVKPGVCGHPASLLDIYPTILDLMDKEPLHEMGGESLVSFIDNPKRLVKRVVHSVSPDGLRYWSLRSRNYRFIQFRKGPVELYNMFHDPDEVHNIASDNPKIVELFQENIPDAVPYGS